MRQQYETGESVNYDFPVNLQPMYLQTGELVPRAKAVVREDTMEPIATVSSQYRLIPHKQVMDEARDFIHSFGEPEISYTLVKNGAVLVAQCTYREHAIEVGVGESVGLRVYIENSYNATKSLCFKIGALNLVCLNGMVLSQDFFERSYRHVGDCKIEFPETSEMLETFQEQGNRWKRYNEDTFKDGVYDKMLDLAIEDKIVPTKIKQTPAATQNNTWGLYNQFTHFVTHSSNASPVGKMNKLGKIDQWFSKNF